MSARQPLSSVSVNTPSRRLQVRKSISYRQPSDQISDPNDRFPDKTPDSTSDGDLVLNQNVQDQNEYEEELVSNGDTGVESTAYGQQSKAKRKSELGDVKCPAKKTIVGDD